MINIKDKLYKNLLQDLMFFCEMFFGAEIVTRKRKHALYLGIELEVTC